MYQFQKAVESQSENFCQLLDGVLWVLDGVSLDPWVHVEVIVVTALCGPVSEEVNLVVVTHVVQAVSLVPTLTHRILFQQNVHYGQMPKEGNIVRFFLNKKVK